MTAAARPLCGDGGEEIYGEMRQSTDLTLPSSRDLLLETTTADRSEVRDSIVATVLFDFLTPVLLHTLCALLYRTLLKVGVSKHVMPARPIISQQVQLLSTELTLPMLPAR